MPDSDPPSAMASTQTVEAIYVIPADPSTNRGCEILSFRAGDDGLVDLVHTEVSADGKEATVLERLVLDAGRVEWLYARLAALRASPGAEPALAPVPPASAAPAEVRPDGWRVVAKGYRKEDEDGGWWILVLERGGRTGEATVARVTYDAVAVGDVMPFAPSTFPPAAGKGLTT